MFTSFAKTFQFGLRRPLNVSLMRSLLSSTGKTAWDSTAVGNWFEVSSTDYTAAATGLSNITKVGMSDAQILENGSSWATNFLTTLPQINATVNSGSYIIGFATAFVNSGANTAALRASTSYKASFSSYTTIANNLTASGSGNKYWLRKTPSAQASTSYVAVWGQSNLRGGTTNWSGSAYNTGSSWTNYNFTLPASQTLVTSTQQW